MKWTSAGNSCIKEPCFHVDVPWNWQFQHQNISPGPSTVEVSAFARLVAAFTTPQRLGRGLSSKIGGGKPGKPPSVEAPKQGAKRGSLFLCICNCTRACIYVYIYIWVNYNISLTWIKAIWGWFPLLTMIPVRSQWGRYNLPRCIYIYMYYNM